MKSRILLLVSAAFAVTVATNIVGHADAHKPTVTIYKSPTCGCCSKWADHVKAAGYPVKLKDVDSLTSIKRITGVPAAYESCHTAVVGGYVVEGHVPVEAIDRILAEQPAIAGIAVPGMPSGSPGMEDGTFDAYQVVTFRNGSTAGSEVLMDVPGR
ncbi:MAG: DUF411 domain-containing protein [Hyphomicrobiales bacterium]|nr:DUF411 domain-containing protein [Hyphomicrobiales bacterium]